VVPVALLDGSRIKRASFFSRESWNFVAAQTFIMYFHIARSYDALRLLVSRCAFYQTAAVILYRAVLAPLCRQAFWTKKALGWLGSSATCLSPFRLLCRSPAAFALSVRGENFCTHFYSSALFGCTRVGGDGWSCGVLLFYARTGRT
jgi:hypothetical protein